MRNFVSAKFGKKPLTMPVAVANVAAASTSFSSIIVTRLRNSAIAFGVGVQFAGRLNFVSVIYYVELVTAVYIPCGVTM